ncbi:MAG: hypothetical protein ACPG5T_01890 [Endozoicomonas sp.]
MFHTPLIGKTVIGEKLVKGTFTFAGNVTLPAGQRPPPPAKK